MPTCGLHVIVFKFYLFSHFKKSFLFFICKIVISLFGVSYGLLSGNVRFLSCQTMEQTKCWDLA